MTLRAALIVLNILAATVVAVVGSAMIISRRAKERMPLNLAAPQNDELLETRKLERVLGTALILSVVIASGLVMYWIFEPNRQADATAGFDKRAVERGAILFATKGMKEYDATRSLLCASCHGADAGGGSTPFVIASARPELQGRRHTRHLPSPSCFLEGSGARHRLFQVPEAQG